MKDGMEYEDVRAVYLLRCAWLAQTDEIWIHKIERMIQYVESGELLRLNETSKKAVVTCNHNGMLLSLIVPV